MFTRNVMFMNMIIDMFADMFTDMFTINIYQYVYPKCLPDMVIRCLCMFFKCLLMLPDMFTDKCMDIYLKDMLNDLW